jgi:hypothetical protein
LRDGLNQLQADGYTIGLDKLQRFRCFGVGSTRIGRIYRLSPQALSDLRYVLEIERRFHLVRDHDALCLQLASRGYPHVPLRRAHDGARKRVAGMFAITDRELHRANDWSGDGFHPRRIPHLARQLARHYIPKNKIGGNPAYGPARDLLQHVFQMLLRVAYNGQEFQERDVLRLLQMLRAPESEAIDLAPRAAYMLNLVAPMIRIGHDNFFQTILRSDPSDAQIEAALRTMRLFPKLLSRISAAGITVSLPSLREYPLVETEQDGLRHPLNSALLSAMYAAAFDLSANEEARQRFERYNAGDTQTIDHTLDQMGATITMIPKVLGLDNAK